jgi:cytochrome P450
MQEDAEFVKGATDSDGKPARRFIPFAEGPRGCVGQTLARLNLAVSLAQLYGSFTFRLASEVLDRSTPGSL